MGDQSIKPVTDLSARVVSLARALDRLPAGTFAVMLTKPDLDSLSWHVEITRVEPIREMELPKRETSYTPGC